MKSKFYLSRGLLEDLLIACDTGGGVAESACLPGERVVASN